MPLCQEDVERSLRILYEVRDLHSSSSSNDEEKLAIEEAIAVLEAHHTSGALPKSPEPVNENGHAQEFWTQYDSIRRSPVVHEGRRINVVEFDNVPKEDGLGVRLDYGEVDSAGAAGDGRSASPNGLLHDRPIVIASVDEGSVASVDGRLRPGDQVLEVNRHTLLRTTLDRARSVLR
eukprot:scpid95956/ scgid4822/ 